MPIILPTEKLSPKRTMPKTVLLYGPPKVGKSTLLSTLEGCLTLDTEEGHLALNSMYLQISSMADFYEVVNAVMKKGTEMKGKYPYQFIALDTIDAMERYCEQEATRVYKNSVKGKNFDGDTVLELSHGLGYYFLREQVFKTISILKQICPHLILISHIKTKELDKSGVATSEEDISLTGKVADIVCNQSDAIGYLYIDKTSKDLSVSFLAPSDSKKMGCRYTYLAGKKFTMDWGTMFPEYTNLHTAKTVLPKGELETVTV